MNSCQKYIAELIDEYDSLLERQIMTMINHKFNVNLTTIEGYVSQMCQFGDYIKIPYREDNIICMKSVEPDYEIIRSFEVMLAFLPRVIWHRRSREFISIRFFVNTLKHDKEVSVIPVKGGMEKALGKYAEDKIGNVKCEVVIFLLEQKEQMQLIESDCCCKFAVIEKDGVVFYKKETE